MRAIAIVVGMFVALLATEAWSIDSDKFKADEATMRSCVDDAEKAKRSAFTDCVGREARRCIDTTEYPWQSAKRGLCAGAELEVWGAWMQAAYSELRGKAEKCDHERCSVFSGVSDFEPILPALESAHEAWRISKERHCELVRIQAGSGTDRFDGPIWCNLDEDAERALLYRSWLQYGIR